MMLRWAKNKITRTCLDYRSMCGKFVIRKTVQGGYWTGDLPRYRWKVSKYTSIRLLDHNFEIINYFPSIPAAKRAAAALAAKEFERVAQMTGQQPKT